MYVEVDELRWGFGEVGFIGWYIEYRKCEVLCCVCWDNFLLFFSVLEYFSGLIIKYDCVVVLENVRKIMGSLVWFVM